MENVMAKKLEWYIEKYGIKEGTRRHTEFRHNVGKSSKGKNTLKGFVDRYGKEEGTRRFNEFKNKSAHTKKSYMNRYGDIWEEKWNAYIEKKKVNSVRRPEYWMNRGMSKVDAIQQVKAIQNNCSVRAYQDRYGDEKGLEKYLEKNRQHSFNISLAGFIERYGESVGVEKFDQYCKDRGRTYDELVQDHGKKKADDIINSRRQTLENYINRLGKEEGTKQYLKRVRKRQNYTSRESIEYFMSLYRYARKIGFQRNDIYWGIQGSKEWYIKEGEEIYFYDFCIPEIGLIVEYNGSHIHANAKLTKEEQNNWSQAYTGKSFKECLKHDQRKNKIASNNGFKVIIVWDYEKNNENLKEKIRDFIKKQRIYRN